MNCGALHVEALRAEAGVELAEDVVAFFRRVLANDGALSPARHASPARAVAIQLDRAAARPFPWWSTAGSPGRISAATTHMSSLKFVLTRMTVIHRALRRHVEGLRHLDDDVGLDVPAVLEHDRRRSVLGIARRRPGVHPRRDRLDVPLAETTFVGEVAVRGICEPRRHLLLHDGGLDRLRPRPRRLVGEQRHRRHLARPVTALAVGLEHGEDVFVEGGRISGSEGSRPATRTEHGYQPRSHHTLLLMHRSTYSIRQQPPWR